MKQGKLDNKLLEKIVFENIKYKRQEVLVRAGIGEDCATIDFGEYDCVVSTDPITASIKDVGRLAIHISCNDIAANGVRPTGIMLAMLLPSDITEKDIEEIMHSAGQAAESVNVEIIGGHTEITAAVNRPVIVSTALGRAIKGENRTSDEIREGDGIFVTKNVGLEGTGIIASDCVSLIDDFFSEKELSYARKMLDEVSVVPEGIIAGELGTHGMHDITEGGVLGAVWEICELSGLGCEILEKQIPVDELTLKFSEALNFDWKRLISSGSMLIVVPQGRDEEFFERFDSENIKLSKIGTLKKKEYGRILMDGAAAVKEIEAPGRDEIYKVIERINT